MGFFSSIFGSNPSEAEIQSRLPYMGAMLEAQAHNVARYSLMGMPWEEIDKTVRRISAPMDKTAQYILEQHAKAVFRLPRAEKKLLVESKGGEKEEAPTAIRDFYNEQARSVIDEVLQGHQTDGGDAGSGQAEHADDCATAESSTQSEWSFDEAKRTKEGLFSDVTQFIAMSDDQTGDFPWVSVSLRLIRRALDGGEGISSDIDQDCRILGVFDKAFSPGYYAVTISAIDLDIASSFTVQHVAASNNGGLFFHEFSREDSDDVESAAQLVSVFSNSRKLNISIHGPKGLVFGINISAAENFPKCLARAMLEL